MTKKITTLVNKTKPLLTVSCSDCGKNILTVPKGSSLKVGR